MNPGGVDVCQTAGPAGCGAGVTAGEKLSLNMLYSSGDAIEQEDTDLFQSDAAQAGVQISTRSASFNTVITDVEPCVLPKFKTAPTCTWQLGEFGVLGESTYPSGEGVLNTGGAFNSGSYSNPTLDKYINESTVGAHAAAFLTSTRTWSCSKHPGFGSRLPAMSPPPSRASPASAYERVRRGTAITSSRSSGGTPSRS